MKAISGLRRRTALATFIVLTACAAGPQSGAEAKSEGAAYGAFLAARYADAQHNPGVATHYYQLALQADPNNQALIDEGFTAALLAGSPHALSWAGQISDNALAVMLLGNQAALQGNYGKAESLFNSLPSQDLAGLLKPILVAWAQAGGGNAEAAVVGLQPNFSNQLLGTVYVLNAALIADLNNDTKNAAQFYTAIGNQQPSLRLMQITASWQARQGQMSTAQTQLAQLVGAHPDLSVALPNLEAQLAKRVINTPTDGMAEAYLTLAGSLDQPQQTILRVTFLRFALTLRPDLTAARLLLANLQAGGANGPGAPNPKPAQLQDALATLQPVEENDPLFGPAAMQEATLLAALNRTPEAVALLDKVAQNNPGNPLPLEAAGDVLRANSQFPQAVDYYNRAIAAVGKPPPASAWVLYFNRAISEDQQGNWAAAEPDLQTALSLSPNQPYVLNYLGYSWAVRGEKLDQAAKMLTEATSIDPGDGQVIDSLGYVKLKQGQTAAAVSLLTQAVELVPTDAEVNAHLGDAFHQAGLGLQADYQWQRALSLGPDPKLKAELLDKLKQSTAG